MQAFDFIQRKLGNSNWSIIGKTLLNGSPEVLVNTLHGKHRHMKLQDIYTFTEDCFFARLSSFHYCAPYRLYLESTNIWPQMSYKIFCQYFLHDSKHFCFIHEFGCPHRNWKLFDPRSSPGLLKIEFLWDVAILKDTLVIEGPQLLITQLLGPQVLL